MTLDELTRPLTPAEVREFIYAAIAARGGSPTTWKSGAPTRTIIAGLAIVVSGMSQLTAAIAKSGFLELAEGDWLTLVAQYVYGVERSAGTFAAGTVTIDNTGGGIYALDPGDLIVINTTTGKGYRNVAAVSINAGQTGVAVDVEALELGSDSTSLAGEIDGFGTAHPGLTVTNAAALIGTDPEDDEALRERCRAKTGTLSPNGPRDAYVYVAKSATKDDGTTAGVTRVRTVADGIGGVTVYVASASGSMPGSVGDTSTALGAVDDAIQRQVTPLAITATTVSATPLIVPVTYEVWVRDTSGLSNAEIEDRVDDALATFMASQPIGGSLLPGESTGRLYKTAVEAAIDGALRAIDDADGFILRRAVTVPAGDTDLASNQAPTVGTRTPTIHQVAEGTL
ncbi:baseplate J/gp47 family protein [Sandaracinus amylolyticus]|uniref:Baseplate assembly protein, putative n=1 Tax=Sandaracinus amylolyticus TaxID=927083 RepID=A0A0F6YHW2_9BACT|nr:baseplate J/gp47 family protein [Sandaracinus amylolyticus]AKF06085.1 baseplate assembly protein, putative [Sandaracinus amylolyticus]